MSHIVYQTKGGLYVNLTNRCNLACVFCHRADAPIVGEYDLRMAPAEEPDAATVTAEITKHLPCQELVYCGFGEPLLRYEVLMDSARRLRNRVPQIRINTNGQGNLILGRNVVPEMVGVIDTLSVSLNAQDQATYDKLCPGTFGEKGYPAVLAFIREGVKCGIRTVATALEGLEGVDITACAELARSLGAEFRARRLDDVTQNFPES